MKKIKYILFTAVIFSFLFITACSTTSNIPQDDVYYSTTPHNNVTAKATPSATQQQKSAQVYQQGKVENISQQSGQTVSGDQYNVDYSARLKRFHQSGDTSLDYYDSHFSGKHADTTKQQSTTTIITPSVSLNLGFGSPYFGSSWSFGFGSYAGWDTGFGYGWGYPAYGWGYSPFYAYYPPYIGWGNPYYGWGNPYYGWNSPYYGWGYPAYGWGYPGWNSGYYPPYYNGYPAYGYKAGIYQPRINRGGGSSIPRSVGGSGIYYNRGVKSASKKTGVVSHNRARLNPDHNGKLLKPNGNSGRPAGSMRYNSALAKMRMEKAHEQNKLTKPGGNTGYRNPNGNRSSRFGISEPGNRSVEHFRKPPAYLREENMPRPRFQKPKQYQSLESRSTRSSKEFYRTPTRPANPGYRRPNVSIYRPQPVRRQNIFRPANTKRNAVYRGSNRARSGIKVYNPPTRSFSSPNSFRAPARRNVSPTRRYSAPTRSISAPTRSISAPVRTGSSSGSGGGGIRRSSGGGGIRR